MQLSQTDGFPEAFLPLATAMGDSLAELRERSDVRWTYVSPAADFQADGPRTGKYVLAGEEFTANEAGESAITTPIMRLRSWTKRRRHGECARQRAYFRALVSAYMREDMWKALAE